MDGEWEINKGGVTRVRTTGKEGVACISYAEKETTIEWGGIHLVDNNLKDP